jgi:hypothetical protein
VFQWFAEDQRLARRGDRSADRAQATGSGDDEFAEYNAYLAELDKLDKKARQD